MKIIRRGERKVQLVFGFHKGRFGETLVLVAVWRPTTTSFIDSSLN
jgi:hypothetical protein